MRADFPSSGWRFSAAVSRTYMSGSLFADIVEEFVAGSSPDVAAMTAILLEQTCTADGFAKVADLCTAFQSQPALANVLQVRCSACTACMYRSCVGAGIGFVV